MPNSSVYALSIIAGCGTKQALTANDLHLRRVEVPGPRPWRDRRWSRSAHSAASRALLRFLGMWYKRCAWEQGANIPSDIAKRFMDEIRHDPEYARAVPRVVVEKGGKRPR